MATIPFSFEFTPLAEVASRFGVSVRHLLLWGAEGKLPFFIRLKTDALIEKIEIECPSCQTQNAGPDDCGRTYPLSLNTLKVIDGDEKKSFQPRLVCDNCQKDIDIKLHLDADHPAFGEAREYYDVKDLLLKAEDLQQFQEKYQSLIGAAQPFGGGAEYPQAEIADERYPGQPGEQPLSGLAKIAAHLGITPDYLKRIWKKKEIPINKISRTGRLYAYPSQLLVWKSSK